MTELTPLQLENSKKSYKKLMANAKAVKKCLEKSGMWENLLKSVNYILDNYSFQDYLDKELWDYCHEHGISQLSGNSWIYRPFKIKSFRPAKLEFIKQQYEAGIPDHYFAYGSYDYSISTCPQDKKAWYSAEYKGCGNGHYYVMLDWDTALFYEDD